MSVILAEIMTYITMAFFACAPFILLFGLIRAIWTGKWHFGDGSYSGPRTHYTTKQYTPTYEPFSDPLSSSLGSRLPHNVCNTSYRTDR